MSIKRQTIIDAVKTRMQSISTANGYYTDVVSVDTWKTSEYESTLANNDLPAINIRDLGNAPRMELIKDSANRWYRDLAIDIRAIVNGSLTDSDIRKLIADVEKAIGTDLTWSGNAIDTEWLGSELERDENEQIIMAAVVHINVYYTTTQWQES